MRWRGITTYHSYSQWGLGSHRTFDFSSSDEFINPFVFLLNSLDNSVNTNYNLTCSLSSFNFTVATITGLRGMFRSVGGAFGISLITIILHSSSSPARGFSATFLSFDLGLLWTIPLVFLMPPGRKGRSFPQEGF